jgi:DNA-binding MarR family transcriptional regulator
MKDPACQPAEHTGRQVKETTIHAFNRVNSEINALYHTFSLKAGMSDSESMILYLLFDLGEGITQSEIMVSLYMSKQTVNSSIAKMQRDGLLQLARKTGRQKRIFLTEAGRHEIQEKIVPLVRLEESIFQSWTKEEREAFLRLNERFRDELREGIHTL